jgi:hypothetical protein
MNRIIAKMRFFNSKSKMDARRMAEMKERMKLKRKRKRMLEQKSTLSDMMEEIREAAN